VEGADRGGVHDVNLFSAVRVTLAMVPLMRKAGGSRVWASSVNGLKGSGILCLFDREGVI
jgi:NAD(P)-dependent dehydrogenase (short-subunit alcohol dehydrogenase family)